MEPFCSITCWEKSFYPVTLDFSDYKGTDNHVRVYASQFEKEDTKSVECFYASAFHEAGYIDEYIYATGMSKLGTCQIIGNGQRRSPVLFIGYGV